VRQDGRVTVVTVEEIRLGDVLSHGCGKVTAILQMTSEEVAMYALKGIRVSGSHLVEHVGEWKSVADHPEAASTYSTSKPVYCFNTTSHRIPVISPDDLSVVFFRDWEEIDDVDHEAHHEWVQLVHTILNPTETPLTNTSPCETPFFSPYTLIDTPEGIKPIANLELGDMIYDETHSPSKVLGVVYGLVNGRPEAKQWNTAVYEKEGAVWIRQPSTVPCAGSGGYMKGYHLITATGTFTYYDKVNDRSRCVRDFTEVGHDAIDRTYSYIVERLKTVCSPGPVIHTDNLSCTQ
jgi:hypothetical protein